MDTEEVEKLLMRYWRCETTPEEEAQLRRFFCGPSVPAHLARYRALFQWQHAMHQDTLGEDFDEQLLRRVQPVVVQARRMSLTARCMPLIKAAAAVAVVLTLGHVVQHVLSDNVLEVAAADTIGPQITAPSVALGEEDPLSVRDRQRLDTLCYPKRPREMSQPE